MSKSLAWTFADLDLGARRCAEDAARREGVSVEEWLSGAIAERATGAAQRYRSRDVDYLGGLSRRRRRDETLLVGAERGYLEPESDWVAAFDSLSRRIALGERRSQRAFESIAIALERWQTGGAQASAAAMVRAAQDRPRKEGEETVVGGASRPPERTPEIKPAETFNSSIAEADVGRSADALSPSDAPSSLRTEGSPTLAAPPPDKRQRDLSAAVSEIAMRRRQLDARGAGVAAEPKAGGPLRSDTPQRAQDASVVTRCDDLQELIARIEELGRVQGESRVAPAEITAMRAEIAGMTKSLADLAPRNAVVALEGAVRDLSERVMALRGNGHTDQVLKPLEAMASELRAAIRAHDPQTAAAGLEREIRAIGGKVDGLAETAINPETFERILRQTEEVRNLLSAAATRSLPLEQFERRIGALADRIESLSVSPAPQMECARMAASLAELRRDIERATPVAALSAIERRLEKIADRLDEELARSASASDAAPFEDLARRIEDVRQSLEARPQAALDTSRLEASLKELTEKLDRPSESQAEAAAPVVDLAPVEDALRSLNDRLERGGDGAFDPRIVEKVADAIVRRIETRRGADPDLLARQIGEIHAHVEALAIRTAQPPDSTVRAMIERLQEDLAASGGGAREEDAWVAAELAQMRAEQANAERQTQNRLGRLQDGFEKLLERLTGIETELTGEALEHPAAPRDVEARTAEAIYAASETNPVKPLSAAAPSSATKDSAEDPPADPSTAEDFLLEPGAGNAVLAHEARELAQAIGSRTNPSVSVHIAAARRAAQAAAEAGRQRRTSPASPRGSLAERGAAIYATHRRSLLLAVALAILATVAVRLSGSQGPLQKSEVDTPANTAASQTRTLPPAHPKSAAVQAPAAKPPEGPRPDAAATGAVDTAPTGSIGLAPDAKNAAPAPTRLPPPDLLATLPSGLPEPLREGVLSGAAAAQYELAQRLIEGRGVAQDQRAAARWFEQAASTGFAPAQYRLGALYEKGVGAPKDIALARSWYLSAAKAGNARAAHNLGVLAAEPPSGQTPDYAEAAKWFRVAAELGVRDSQYNLAVLYARGLGINQDLRQSWMWFSLAAAQGDADATRKRDEVAAKLDSTGLTEATELLGKLRTQKPNPAANDVAAPPGGWDGKAAQQSGQSLIAPWPGPRAKRAL